MSPTGKWKDDNIDVAGSPSGTADGNYDYTGDLDQAREHNAANEIYHATLGSAITETQGDSWCDPYSNLVGNMSRIPAPGDESTAASQLYFWYDGWNRLVKVKQGTNPGPGSSVIAEYRYDGLGRRIRKYTDQGSNQCTAREYYYNTAWQVLQVDKDTETRDDTSLPEPAVADTMHEQYVWSQRYIDAPILRDRDSDGDPDDGDLGQEDSGLDERLYYLTDVNMNVTALVNTSGDAVERYAYDPYGRVTVLHGAYGTDTDVDNSGVYEWQEDTTPDVANEILFCGYRINPETGLYQVRNREYHPTLGRWLQRDPLGYVDGMSLYEYVASGPMGGPDPFGLKKPPRDAQQPGESNYQYRQRLLRQATEGTDFNKDVVDDQNRRAVTSAKTVGVADAVAKDLTENSGKRAVEYIKGIPRGVYKVGKGIWDTVSDPKGAYQKVVDALKGVRILAENPGAIPLIMEVLLEEMGDLALKDPDAFARLMGKMSGEIMADLVAGKVFAKGVTLTKEAIKNAFKNGKVYQKIKAIAAKAEKVGRKIHVDEAGSLPPRKSVKAKLQGLTKGKQKHVRTVKTEKELADLYDDLTRGGTSVKPGTYPGQVKKLPDGTVVRMRPGSKSGGAAIDVTHPDGSIGKVHVE